MLGKYLAFEIRYWFRSWMLWIFLLIIAAMIFLARPARTNITLGDALSNTYRNSPYNIQNFYSFIGLFTMMMATAFVNSAAARDFSFNTYQIIFSTPHAPIRFPRRQISRRNVCLDDSDARRVHRHDPGEIHALG